VGKRGISFDLLQRERACSLAARGTCGVAQAPWLQTPSHSGGQGTGQGCCTGQGSFSVPGELQWWKAKRARWEVRKMHVATAALNHRAAPVSGRVREGPRGRRQGGAGSNPGQGAWRTPKPSPNCIPRGEPSARVPRRRSPLGPGTLPPHHPSRSQPSKPHFWFNKAGFFLGQGDFSDQMKGWDALAYPLVYSMWHAPVIYGHAEGLQPTAAFRDYFTQDEVDQIQMGEWYANYSSQPGLLNPLVSFTRLWNGEM